MYDAPVQEIGFADGMVIARLDAADRHHIARYRPLDRLPFDPPYLKKYLLEVPFGVGKAGHHKENLIGGEPFQESLPHRGPGFPGGIDERGGQRIELAEIASGNQRTILI